MSEEGLEISEAQFLDVLENIQRRTDIVSFLVHVPSLNKLMPLGEYLELAEEKMRTGQVRYDVVAKDLFVILNDLPAQLLKNRYELEQGISGLVRVHEVQADLLKDVRAESESNGGRVKELEG